MMILPGKISSETSKCRIQNNITAYRDIIGTLSGQIRKKSTELWDTKLSGQLSGHYRDTIGTPSENGLIMQKNDVPIADDDYRDSIGTLSGQYRDTIGTPIGTVSGQYRDTIGTPSENGLIMQKNECPDTDIIKNKEYRINNNMIEFANQIGLDGLMNAYDEHIVTSVFDTMTSVLANDDMNKIRINNKTACLVKYIKPVVQKMTWKDAEQIVRDIQSTKTAKTNLNAYVLTILYKQSVKAKRRHKATVQPLRKVELPSYWNETEEEKKKRHDEITRNFISEYLANHNGLTGDELENRINEILSDPDEINKYFQMARADLIKELKEMK